MNPARRAPQALKYVAYLYLFIGFFSLAVMIARVTHGTLGVNLGIGALPIGWGLLRLWRRAYTWALIVCTVYLFISPMTLFWFVLAPVHYIPRSGLRFPALETGMILGGVIWALSMGLAVWQLKVLLSAPVRRVFAPDVETREAP